MTTTNLITESVDIIHRVGLEGYASHLDTEKRRLTDPNYRVAFLGQFKTGKSTLINRLFLKENILFTDVMEATAIPVEIVYGETKQLEIYSLQNESPGSDRTSPPAQVFANPSAEVIRENTSGETPEQRADLASRVSHARLTWPAQLLKRFTIVDTPGVNTPNEAVATATYRFLPECDLALYVALPRQLSSVDLQFLRGQVFSAGIVRAMILLNYDPRYEPADRAQLEAIRKAVESSIRQIGRENIPVVLSEVPRITGPATDFLSSETTASKTAVDWLTGKPIGEHSEEMSPAEKSVGDVLELEKKLVSYIQENLFPAREEKVQIRLRSILENVLREIQIELRLLEQDLEERREKAKELIQAQKEVTRETEVVKQFILSDLRHLEGTHKLSLLRNFEALKGKVITEISAKKTLGELQTFLRAHKNSLQLEVETMILEVQRASADEWAQLNQRYSNQLAETAMQWQGVDTALQIDGGLLEKAPSALLQIADYALTALISPFPFFVDIPLRTLIGKFFPLLERIMPLELALSLLKKNVVDQSEEQFSSIIENLSTSIRSAYQETEQRLSRAWDEETRRQQQSVVDATDRSLAPQDPQRLSVLKEASTQIKAVLAQLPLTH